MSKNIDIYHSERLHRLSPVSNKGWKKVTIPGCCHVNKNVKKITNKVGRNRGGSRRVVKFLSESNTFHIKSNAIKMLSCKNFATLLDPSLRNRDLKKF